MILPSRHRLARTGPLLLLLLSLAHDAAATFDSPDSGEAVLPPRPGTSCRLLSREVLTGNGTLPAVHRLRFAMPATARSPRCCGGHADGMLHVRVRAPDAAGQAERLQPYSAHRVDDASFDLVVKVYPGGPPAHAGVSGYLGQVAVGEDVHVPEIRALDWRRDSPRAGLICFGVGVTECVGPAAALLARGGEVRMIYANRRAEDRILLTELRELSLRYPTRFRVRHCLSSRKATTTTVPPGDAAADIMGANNERVTWGRVDHTVLQEEFGGTWRDGGTAEHFLMVGTPAMEQAVLGMIARARLYDFSKIRGHPPFLLIKGPHGDNSKWVSLSPPESEEEEL